MAKRKQKPLKCVAPYCTKDADHHVSASGDSCGFYGPLCDEHYELLKKCFPATVWNVAFLHIITREALDAALAEQTS
jgi:hypothetical protein